MDSKLKMALELHNLINNLSRFSYPSEEDLIKIPTNGIYINFEEGEKIEGVDRIVRIGTDTGNNQLHSRLFNILKMRIKEGVFLEKTLDAVF